MTIARAHRPEGDTDDAHRPMTSWKEGGRFLKRALSAPMLVAVRATRATERPSLSVAEHLVSHEADAVRAGVDVATSTPEEFAALVRSELDRWGKVVRETGATVN